MTIYLNFLLMEYFFLNGIDAGRESDEHAAIQNTLNVGSVSSISNVNHRDDLFNNGVQITETGKMDACSSQGNRKRL